MDNISVSNPDASPAQIVSRPDVCGGKPCVAGTRIRVQDIYIWHDVEGRSADEIVSEFPQLSMSAVYAAMAYYWGRREEIDRKMDADAKFVAEMIRQHPSRLADRLRARYAANDQVSP